MVPSDVLGETQNKSPENTVSGEHPDGRRTQLTQGLQEEVVPGVEEVWRLEIGCAHGSQTQLVGHASADLGDGCGQARQQMGCVDGAALLELALRQLGAHKGGEHATDLKVITAALELYATAIHAQIAGQEAAAALGARLKVDVSRSRTHRSRARLAVDCKLEELEDTMRTWVGLVARVLQRVALVEEALGALEVGLSCTRPAHLKLCFCQGLR